MSVLKWIRRTNTSLSMWSCTAAMPYSAWRSPIQLLPSGSCYSPPFHLVPSTDSFLACLEMELFPLYVVLAEPVGSVKPKINVQDKLQTREIAQNAGFALLCPAQSYPMPAYRYITHLPPFRITLHVVRPFYLHWILKIVQFIASPTR